MLWSDPFRPLYDYLGLDQKLDCHTFSFKDEFKEYKGVGLTVAFVASVQICSCCGGGRAVDVNLASQFMAGIGIADEVTIWGVKFGYSILGPQVSTQLQLHYVQEYGETRGKVQARYEAAGDISGTVSGGVGIGSQGRYGG